MAPPKTKKRKTSKDESLTATPTEEPIVPLKTQPSFSSSVCIPSSIIAHCKDLSQVTACVYQVARALCIYNVGEVIVLDVDVEDEEEEQVVTGPIQVTQKKIKFGEDELFEPKKKKESAKKEEIKEELLLVASLLQFFITPPYLVKSSFTSKQLNFFKEARRLPKISTLPFMLNNSEQYKEGLSIPKKKTKKNLTKFINIGTSQALEIDQEIPANVRVTVDIKNKKLVSPKDAYGVIGSNSKFGYHVRIAKKFNQVFTESAVPLGYTKTIYCNAGDFFQNQLAQSDKFAISKAVQVENGDKLLLIIGEFGRLQKNFQKDDDLKELESFKQMCDFEMDIVKGCRIEDGLMIALTKVDSLSK